MSNAAPRVALRSEHQPEPHVADECRLIGVGSSVDPEVVAAIEGWRCPSCGDRLMTHLVAEKFFDVEFGVVTTCTRYVCVGCDAIWTLFP